MTRIVNRKYCVRIAMGYNNYLLKVSDYYFILYYFIHSFPHFSMPISIPSKTCTIYTDCSFLN